MRRTLGDLRDIFAQPAVLSRAQVLAAVGRHGLQIALDNEILVKISQGQYAPKAHAQAWWTGCAAAVATRDQERRLAAEPRFSCGASTTKCR